jgi:hypothetical protein
MEERVRECLLEEWTWGDFFFFNQQTKIPKLRNPIAKSAPVAAAPVASGLIALVYSCASAAGKARQRKRLRQQIETK